jgi:hypothetical protein
LALVVLEALLHHLKLQVELEITQFFHQLHQMEAGEALIKLMLLRLEVQAVVHQM